MGLTIEELVEQAMNLPAEERARLADLLVESLDADGLGSIDRLWLVEAKRRRDDVRSGRVRSIPGDEALQKVRDALCQSVRLRARAAI
jgi:putative addiction module component (TIGR02574 family)